MGDASNAGSREPIGEARLGLADSIPIAREGITLLARQIHAAERCELALPNHPIRGRVILPLVTDAADYISRSGCLR